MATCRMYDASVSLYRERERKREREEEEEEESLFKADAVKRRRRRRRWWWWFYRGAGGVPGRGGDECKKIKGIASVRLKEVASRDTHANRRSTSRDTHTNRRKSGERMRVFI